MKVEKTELQSPDLESRLGSCTAFELVEATDQVSEPQLSYLLAGLAFGAVAFVSVHEFGHALVDLWQGGIPSFNVYLEPWGGFGTIGTSHINANGEYDFAKRVNVTAGGPVADITSAASALGFFAKSKSPKAKSFAQGLLSAGAALLFYPAMNFAFKYAFNVSDGDYSLLDSAGIPYSITLPAMSLLAAVSIYYAQKSEVRTLKPEVEEMRDRLVSMFGQRLKYNKGFKPAFFTKLEAKLRRTTPFRIAAEKAYQRMSNIELSCEGDVAELRETDVYKFADKLCISPSAALHIIARAVSKNILPLPKQI